MANSKYEYVKLFERCPTLLLNTFIVVRVDGRGFHKLSAKYSFEKPNDRRALDLMNAAATAVMKELPDIDVAYGISDEYRLDMNIREAASGLMALLSFVFDRSTRWFDRRESKILTTIVSTFTSYFIHLWPSYFPEQSLSPPLPSFDGRVVLYPSSQNVRDYLNWRQADCMDRNQESSAGVVLIVVEGHINNLYNTTFWALVQKSGIDATAAEEQLKGTLSSHKNEILYDKFKINYNNEPDIFRKGSVLYRNYEIFGPNMSRSSESVLVSNDARSKSQDDRERKKRQKATITLQHTDIIQDEFWRQRPWLLSV